MKKIAILICICISLGGCKALIEENIRASKVNVLFPKAGDSLSTYNINFWWDKVPNATSYEVQIVQGSFTSIQNFIVDSTTSNNSFSFVLSPGTYQWKVRALNNSTQTDFAIQSFVVLRNDSINAQSVILQYPPDNYSSNQTTQIFRWYPVAQTTYYTFQLLTTAGALVYSTDLSADSITLTGIQPGDLVWKVRASNNSASTPFSTRAIIIDTIAPNVPVLTAPAYGDSISGTVNLAWDRGATSGSAISDSIFIYSDSLITIYQRNVSATNSYLLPTIPIGTYFWRIKSLDQAGNIGGFSLPGKFKVY